MFTLSQLVQETNNNITVSEWKDSAQTVYVGNPNCKFLYHDDMYVFDTINIAMYVQFMTSRKYLRSYMGDGSNFLPSGCPKHPYTTHRNGNSQDKLYFLYDGVQISQRDYAYFIGYEGPIRSFWNGDDLDLEQFDTARNFFYFDKFIQCYPKGYVMVHRAIKYELERFAGHTLPYIHGDTNAIYQHKYHAHMHLPPFHPQSPNPRINWNAMICGFGRA